jgi:hypothetical protein
MRPAKQIRHDIAANAHKRLAQWIDDTIMRCKAVEMSAPDCERLMGSCLFMALTVLADGREDQLLALVKKMIKQIKADRHG